MSCGPRRSLISVSVWCTCTVYASHPHVVTSSSINVEASECRSYKAVSFPSHFYTQSVVETDFQSLTCFSRDSHQKLLQTFCLYRPSHVHVWSLMFRKWVTAVVYLPLPPLCPSKNWEILPWGMGGAQTDSLFPESLKLRQNKGSSESFSMHWLVLFLVS